MDAKTILFYGQETILKTLDGLPDKDYETAGVCGVWSVRNIMAHLASYEYMLVDVLNSVMGSSDLPTLSKMAEGTERFNEIVQEEYRDKSLAEIMDNFKNTYQQTMALAEKIPADLWAKNGTLPWYGDTYSLDDFIVYTFYGHKREHSAQIAVFRDSL
jgi:hypothetical protein